MQKFLSHTLLKTSSTVALTGGGFIWHCCLILEDLYACNQSAYIIPESEFYNHDVAKYFNIFIEFEKFKHYVNVVKPRESLNSIRNFNIYLFPFLLAVEVKAALLKGEFQISMQKTVSFYMIEILCILD